MAVDHQDVGNVKSWQINDQVSRIGFKGSEDLGGGLKALWQIEQGISATAANNAVGGAGGSTLGSRNTFVGLSGNFGTAVLGRYDTPYKLSGSADLFADTTADTQCASAASSPLAGAQCVIGRNGFDQRNEMISYMSPSFSGVTVSAAVMPGQETTNANDADGLADGYSLAVVYANGPLRLSAAYENYDKLVGAATASDRDAWKLNGSYKFGDLTVGLTYEASTAGGAANDDDTGWLASVAYGMGPITLGAQYASFDNDGGRTGDIDRWTIGAYYGMSKRTTAYVAYHDGDLQGANAAADTDAKIFTVGVNHSF
jgi:predicted porin